MHERTLAPKQALSERAHARTHAKNARRRQNAAHTSTRTITSARACKAPGGSSDTTHAYACSKPSNADMG
eukprot:4178158-Pleurochrysis_carterae.AAC.1